MKRAEALPPVLPEGWRIRHGRPEDLETVLKLERACFPEAEAAGREQLRQRLAVYPDHFWLLLNGGCLVSFADGMAVSQRDLTDDLYADAALHDPSGDWQMLFGVCTRPESRRQGAAGLVIRQAVAEAAAGNRKGLILACKDALVPYYARFGFRLEGRSESRHGNADWNQMRLTFC